MQEEKSINYWLFQAHPKVLRMPAALRAGALSTFGVKAHKEKIQKGDGIILWQTGDDGGCYGLARATSDVEPMAATPQELPFYSKFPTFGPRVRLSLEYNLWDRPITRDMLPDIPAFQAFYAGLPGTNYRATASQYRELEKLIRQFDQAHEPATDYRLMSNHQHPLNLILYGPPGTGKTYATINHALSIIERRSLEELSLEKREELRRRYSDYLRNGRVAFVTFHQSFSYEDFIEGIKPYTREGQVHYRVEDGIFKTICRDAHHHVAEALYHHYPDERPVLEFNQLYSAFLDYLQGEDFNFFEGKNQRRFFLHRVLRFGDLSVRPATSFLVQAVKRKFLRDMYQRLFSPEKVEEVGWELAPIIGEEDPSIYWAVFSALKNFELNMLKGQEEEAQSVEKEAQTAADVPGLPFELPLVPDHILAKAENYVLIIDEINRGNVPAIFGELITLLEEDKRDGASEAASAILPYSKDLFSVPPNLYLIGTMNTADRSTEALDVALRRRFAFQAIQPDAALVASGDGESQVSGVDIVRLLDAINRRLTLLLGPEYQLGHAYFLDIHAFDGLRKTFEQHVIPLLQEYFFNDFGKIGLVLGREFIRERQRQRDDDFADFDYPFADGLSERRLYELRPSEEWTEAAFIRIYEAPSPPQ